MNKYTCTISKDEKDCLDGAIVGDKVGDMVATTAAVGAALGGPSS